MNPGHRRWNVGAVVNALQMPLHENQIAMINHPERSGIVTENDAISVKAIKPEHAETREKK